MKRLFVLAATLSALAALPAQAGERGAVGGAIIGGATGAIIGGAATGHAGGAVAGGVIGATTGAIIGSASEDRRRCRRWVTRRDDFGRRVSYCRSWY